MVLRNRAVILLNTLFRSARTGEALVILSYKSFCIRKLPLYALIYIHKLFDLAVVLNLNFENLVERKTSCSRLLLFGLKHRIEFSTLNTLL